MPFVCPCNNSPTISGFLRPLLFGNSNVRLFGKGNTSSNAMQLRQRIRCPSLGMVLVVRMMIDADAGDDDDDDDDDDGDD